jgi:hypothetical protein
MVADAEARGSEAADDLDALEAGVVALERQVRMRRAELDALCADGFIPPRARFPWGRLIVGVIVGFVGGWMLPITLAILAVC